MKLRYGFGNGIQEVEVPEKNLIGELHANPVPAGLGEEEEIARALRLKAMGRYGRVVVTGCYPQRYPDAAGRFPGVDAWQGVPQKWVEPKTPRTEEQKEKYRKLRLEMQARVLKRLGE